MNASGTAGTSGTAPQAGSPSTPKARYGKRSGGTFTGKILAVVFAAMMLAAVVYIVAMLRNQSTVDVTAVETGGSVVSDHEIKASIDITRDDPSKPAYCIIYALDYEKNDVGRREIALPAGGDKTVRVETTMPTRERAHAAKVYGCSSDLPPYLTPETQN
ncbi:DUF4307 domain-containing protein [Corynebacterium sp. 320]|uniref:DUF4307 domain-containing protein n=1 Tax=Corynebacterium zhongnanshanii TaxID=2768834 RepID=A0ABQ6VFR9_9CORY|nr:MULTISPECIES: DUF4307 domain-containing protein [Corynebacterium]KAB1504034.1 DUF4307 domain-containing protein [Corynebacterium sp. 320]KAB1552867.1 DUF4307 domain-containing protein [Corynebacterium sp. 321]KAB1553915.1 DUF4307 domain-containing protein [Corynebacterium sp. 319]KAB3523115.1 DUF4307 domain-containing protein [Corynebacterium zhongnanshanii]KAB3528170.1 DUF4307 domain-containing protein [Corynebacterium sp. 250]